MPFDKEQSRSTGRRIFHGVLVVLGASVMTVSFLLILPVIQSISETAKPDILLESVDAVSLPPPVENAVEEEPPPEPEPEEPPPELSETMDPLDLTQLSLALNPGEEAGGIGGRLAVALGPRVSKGSAVGDLFSLSDLDQKPRPIYQANPVLTREMMRKAPGRVYIVFIVDERGKVVNPKIQESSNPVFERAALSAVKKWKFQPGKRNGKPVRFKMRVPMIFPKR